MTGVRSSKGCFKQPTTIVRWLPPPKLRPPQAYSTSWPLHGGADRLGVGSGPNGALRHPVTLRIRSIVGRIRKPTPPHGFSGRPYNATKGVLGAGEFRVPFTEASILLTDHCFVRIPTWKRPPVVLMNREPDDLLIPSAPPSPPVKPDRR
jgi:hypothetical protein